MHPTPDRRLRLAAALWLAAMLALPIGRWVAGADALPSTLAVGVAAQVVLVVGALARAWGLRRALLGAAVVAGGGWLAEAVGVRTGWPFGAYAYTALLRPSLGGVPVLVPLSWLMMLPCAWAVAAAVAGDGSRRRLARVGHSALAFTAWDLFLDPQMVGWGVWQWRTPGAYFGIPLQNFAGWIAVAALLTAVARPAPLGAAGAVLVAVYALTAALQTLGLALFWGQPGPALCGAVAMGGYAAAAWRRAGPA